MSCVCKNNADRFIRKITTLQCLWWRYCIIVSISRHLLEVLGNGMNYLRMPLTRVLLHNHSASR